VVNVERHKKHSYAAPLNESSVAHVTACTGGWERPSGPVSKRAGLDEVVVRVGADDEAVEPFVRHAGTARDSCPTRNGVRERHSKRKGLLQPRPVDAPRVVVLTEVGLAFEGTIAVDAIAHR
jgi:hypothetical protein